MAQPNVTVERVRHELKFRLAEVVSADRITPKMMRVVLTTPDFEGFKSLAYDDHVKLFFPPESGDLIMPVDGPNGPEMPDGIPRPEGRDYTPRFFDEARNELTIDFVIHGDGIATKWAEDARPGRKIGVGGPRGSFVVRGDADFWLLVGDETALPAIGRRIEELPDGAKIQAFIEIIDKDEQQLFATGADLTVNWVPRQPGQPGHALAEAVERALLPAGSGYAFIAGESSMSKRLRRHLVEIRKFDPDHVKAAGYWADGSADFYDGHEH